MRALKLMQHDHRPDLDGEIAGRRTTECDEAGQSTEWTCRGGGTRLVNDGIEEPGRVGLVDVGVEVVKRGERASVHVGVELGVRVGEGEKEWAVG